ncbi:MAG: signal peptidase I [Candidatus Terrybacteria bacterium RIFCSPHIGHO2_01_FULL_48_17]|uniref:Signal peptidase I n=1 Tax=Candidatus Terrybacteria bacterium RIFCSPHIGHO2_01_FULL_48_17 TaxID=1802362 RepID=A0A1G2PJE2_9BACT|nr:MAG: signal peptidase I [Candidatus Terrybacteria bacterium RIFCSPHIGHO2_01_FULL_48_17]OHA52283.1 MAG: signal peptidase I [Candidatus Terrybacteria bacterium RIFCSPLOWO2_01_FULL_48_14]
MCLIMKSFFSFIWDSAKVIFVALAIILPIRLYVAQPFFVRGYSMEPMYSNGDYLIVDELSYHFRKPERGEIIVFRFPQDPSQFFIKRIIGLPGETVRAKDGHVVVEQNGEQVAELSEGYISDSLATGEFELSAGPDEYIVLGDNRGASSDSRRWGTLAREAIVGRAFLRVWPPQHFSVFAAPMY